MPNTIDAFRFSQGEIDLFAAWWTQVLAGGVALPALAAVSAESDLFGAEELKLVDAMGKALDAPRQQLPWWATLAVQNRDEFVGCAIAMDWDRSQGCFPPEIFVVVLAVQQPPGLHLLRCSLKLKEWPELPMTGPFALDPWLMWAHYESALDFQDAASLAANGDELLYVLPSVVHVSNGVATRSEPIALDEFCRTMPPRQTAQRTTTGERRIRATVSAQLLEKLQEEFPWLTENDIRVAKAKSPSKSGESGPKQELVVRCVEEADYEDMAYETVMAALESKREEWRFEEDEVSVNFYPALVGGVWTRKYKGVATGAAHAKGRAHTAPFARDLAGPSLKSSPSTHMVSRLVICSRANGAATGTISLMHGYSL